LDKEQPTCVYFLNFFVQPRALANLEIRCYQNIVLFFAHLNFFS